MLCCYSLPVRWGWVSFLSALVPPWPDKVPKWCHAASVDPRLWGSSSATKTRPWSRQKFTLPHLTPSPSANSLATGCYCYSHCCCYCCYMLLLPLLLLLSMLLLLLFFLLRQGPLHNRPRKIITGEGLAKDGGSRFQGGILITHVVTIFNDYVFQYPVQIFSIL